VRPFDHLGAETSDRIRMAAVDGSLGRQTQGTAELVGWAATPLHPPRVVQDGLHVGDADALEEDDGVGTGDGKPLLIATGGGGGGYGSPESGQVGPGGGERGQDGTKLERGGKGAAGPTGGAGGGNGSPGADASAGGKEGTGGEGGGAGYVGGGGDGGTDEDRGVAGSGAGGSSYVDPNRVTGTRLLSGDRTQDPAENDPFRQASDEPVRGGIAEGGSDTTELAVPTDARGRARSAPRPAAPRRSSP
ncbi:hypothetical protein ACIRIU_19830, partial [Streptomyces sp. NPDC102351]